MKDILYKILWSTIEDNVGLWEISWELNTLFPKNNLETNKKLAKKILFHFLELGLINFYFSKWGSDEINMIDRLSAIDIINSDKFWEAPSLNELCVKVGNTEKGENFYTNELINDLPL